MDTAVKTKAKPVRALKKGESAVLFPGATAAEPWEVWVLGTSGMAECVQVCASPRDCRLRKNTTLALPASHVFSLPLWLNETDPKIIPGMIALQLELRGLQPRNAPAIFDWSIIAQETGRTLVLAGVLPAQLPEELAVEEYDHFNLSFCYLTFPENALILLREQDRLVLAMTRGARLAYYQVLTDPQITTRNLQDITCARATLSMQGVVTDLQSITLWTELTPTEQGDLHRTLQLPVRQSSRPLPRPPEATWKLIPASVTEAQRSRYLTRWRNRALWALLGLYLIVVAVLGLRYYLTTLHVADLENWQASHAETLSQVRSSQAAWKELTPVVDQNSYPLELLLHAANAIPQDQFHLTLFEAANGHILVKGEAKNVAAAFQFAEHLKADKFFSAYTWEVGQPRLLPNDLAQIQIEGTHAP